MVDRLPIIGVMGSGKSSYAERSEPLGRWIAQSGFHLLTGGGGGVMTAVSKAFSETPARKGLSIGIIPGNADTPYSPSEGYPNPWIEIPIFTHLPLSGSEGISQMSRNHINVLSAHVIVALPGSSGTASEVTLALHYNKPVIGFLESLNEIEGLKEKIPVYSKFSDLTAQIINELKLSDA